MALLHVDGVGLPVGFISPGHQCPPQGSNWKSLSTPGRRDQRTRVSVQSRRKVVQPTTILSGQPNSSKILWYTIPPKPQKYRSTDPQNHSTESQKYRPTEAQKHSTDPQKHSTEAQNALIKFLLSSRTKESPPFTWLLFLTVFVVRMAWKKVRNSNSKLQ